MGRIPPHILRRAGWAIAAIGVVLVIAGLVSGTMRGVTGGAIVIGLGLLIGARSGPGR